MSGATTIRVAGERLEPNKHLDIALSAAIYGIGRPTAIKLCQQLGVSPQTKAAELSEAQLEQLRQLIEAIPTGGNLRTFVRQAIDRLKKIRSYRGLRHQRHLPVRGQRTRTNARTRKGPKRMVKK